MTPGRLALLAVLLAAAPRLALAAPPPRSVVRIGYFHGGRTGVVFRAHLNGFFEKEGVDARLVTQNLREGEFFEVPRSTEDFKITNTAGKISGVELIEEMVRGRVDAALVGESSFLLAAEEGKDLVAVALLGHDLKDRPGHAIIFRKGLEIKTPADIRGLTLGSRRAGPGDDALLREFVASVGLDPDKDVTLTADVSDDRLDRMLRKTGKSRKGIDGGYFHLMQIRQAVEKDKAWVYRPLNWVNAELSQALLVFNRRFVREHPDAVRRTMRALVAEIAYERTLTPEQKKASRKKGLQIEEDFLGMDLPQCDLPPLVRRDLLDEMQALLLKHRKLSRKTDIGSFIDNSFVEAAAKQSDAR